MNSTQDDEKHMEDGGTFNDKDVRDGEEYSSTKIAILIKKITPSFKVTGESIIRGIRPPLTGVVVGKKGIYAFSLK